MPVKIRAWQKIIHRVINHPNKGCIVYWELINICVSYSGRLIVNEKSKPKTAPKSYLNFENIDVKNFIFLKFFYYSDVDSRFNFAFEIIINGMGSFILLISVFLSTKVNHKNPY